MTRRYQLYDLCIGTESDHPTVEQMLDRTLHYKGAELLESPTAADITLDFQAGRSVTEIPGDARLLGQSAHGGIDAWMTDDCMLLRHGEATVQLIPRAGTAMAALTPDLLAAHTNTHTQRDPLFYLITFSLIILLRYRGWYALHTAALALDGRGLLLVAESDSGKSTATLNLVRQGWAYLSDDTVLLHTVGHRVLAHSFRRNFCVDPEATTLFPELADHDWPTSLSDATKWQVDIDALYPGQFTPTTTPRILIAPDITEGPKSRLEPMDAKAALGQLIDQGALFLTPDPTVARRHLEVFRQLVQQAHAYRLHAGRDLLDRPDRIHALLAPLLRDASAPV
jgi:hypothetical protein